jgi:hypothetical protein
VRGVSWDAPQRARSTQFCILATSLSEFLQIHSALKKRGTQAIPKGTGPRHGMMYALLKPYIMDTPA